MIREIKKSDIKMCTELILECNIGSNLTRYFPKDEREIINRLDSEIESKNHIILVCEYDKKIIGFLEFLIESDEKYIQILAYFSNVNYESCFDEFYKILHITYKGFTIDFVVNDFNISAINYMKKINAQTDGLDTMLYIEKNLFKANKESFARLLPNEYESKFVKLHDTIFPDVYWNGKRLLKEKDGFKKLIVTEDNQITGFVVLSSFNRTEEEVYFLYAKDIRTKINLIDEALKLSFKKSNTVLLLIPENDNSEIKAYTDYGFSIKEKIYTFTIHIY
ncbi:MAG: hypothetical protein H7A30_00600 [Thermotogae bacterium]|nr:hypothetical protein [Thermotogota bacterium]